MQQHLPFTVLKPTEAWILLGASKLQQFLPFTVLKQQKHQVFAFRQAKLQQFLPFMVLKRAMVITTKMVFNLVATVLTVHGMRRRV